MEPKTVRYSITHKDLLAFSLRAIVRNRLIQGTIILLVAYVAYVGLFIQVPGNQPQPSMAVRVVATIVMEFAAIFAMVAFLLSFLFLMLWTKRFKGVIGEHELTLTDTGIISKSPLSETTRKWNALFRIVSTRNQLLLYVNETSAMIVPKRCFASATEATDFEQTIRDRAKTD
jgi:hypothetical protein